MFFTAVGCSVFTLTGHFEFSVKKKQAAIWAVNYACVVLPSCLFQAMLQTLKKKKKTTFHLALNATGLNQRCSMACIGNGPPALGPCGSLREKGACERTKLNKNPLNQFSDSLFIRSGVRWVSQRSICF